MKARGWINMRRLFGDAFEETTMMNVPIDQFWSFKWRNGVQNWNLCEKLSKIGLFGKFWLLIKGQRKSQSQWILVWINSGFPSRVTNWAAKSLMSSYDMSLMSSYDMSLMWTRADVYVLVWLLTWSNDIIRWRQDDISSNLLVCESR